MHTLAELQTQLRRLQDQRATPEASVAYDGSEVTYKTDAQLAAAIADLESRIASVEGRQVRKVRITTSKGL